MMKEQVLTVEEAYRAMFYFLEGEYELTKSDELGGAPWFIVMAHLDAWKTR
ncbi:hypothetical protein [Achromobacter xylosoxidans]|uniref:hypothetical protein n=1 Tax=Alcaligenes xylosoxydans xylosoxydans TaxID=85698 RepID=UPI001F331295|nr:hypothetical protein [Achromobacter xylosoxidans]